MIWALLGLLLFSLMGIFSALVDKWRCDFCAEDFIEKARLVQIFYFRKRGSSFVRASSMVRAPDNCRIPISVRRAQIKRFEYIERDFGKIIANKYRSEYWIFLKKNMG